MSTNDPENPPVLRWTADKAWVGAGVSALVAGLTSLFTALEDGTLTGQEWITLVLAMLVGSGLTGAAVYQKANHPK